jgi:hypothetical protein
MLWQGVYAPPGEPVGTAALGSTDVVVVVESCGRGRAVTTLPCHVAARRSATPEWNRRMMGTDRERQATE